MIGKKMEPEKPAKEEEFVIPPPGILDQEKYPLPEHIKKFIEEEAIHIGEKYGPKQPQEKYAGQKEPVEEKEKPYKQ